MDAIVFSSKLEQDPDGTWWYVHVPKDIRDRLKQFEKRGIIHVLVTIGKSTWDGSMLPWTDGSAQISINKGIRSKENLNLGDTLSLSVKPR
jgi:fructose-1-phosphate kinase PfkB-like protein